MKSYTKIYFDFFGYDESDFIGCEVCGQKAVDISHIEAKGRRPDLKDNIFNLMAMCRPCHVKYGDKKAFKDKLRETHLFTMATAQPSKTEDMLNEMYEKIEVKQ